MARKEETGLQAVPIPAMNGKKSRDQDPLHGYECIWRHSRER